MNLSLNIVKDIKLIIAQSKEKAIRSVDFERTLMYWHIGERIFIEEQKGKNRADYGKYLIKSISEALQPEFGSGFSARQLELMRQFHRTFPIANTLYSQLNWSQYKLLLQLDNPDKREYYIAETVKNNWTVRQMERQINSQLYERLLISNDKESAYYEKDFEQALITHLQDFLLELGNGFSFVARQKRIHLDGDEFFIDLVFYNRLLQCFVLFEIKTHKLTHQDIGQLQMYVNYFDRNEKTDFEKSTIGILLCADKNNTVVKYSLPENNNSILASQYQLYLPTEEQLIKELRRELEIIDNK